MGEFEPPRLGQYSRDEEPETATVAAAPVRPESLALATGDPLCPVCVHAPVCAVAASIRLVGGEGAIVVSRCPAFECLPEGVSPEPAGG